MRLCEWCSTALPVDAHVLKRYCSGSCRAARLRAAADADGRSRQWRDVTNERQRRKAEVSVCQQCGVSFQQTHKRRYCSRKCSNRAYALDRKTRPGYRQLQAERQRRRRAQKRTPTVERFMAEEIYERDGWRCHLCQRKVRRKVDPNHDMAPTIDHLTPLALGGEHSRANVATAHRICNSRKNFRGAGDQLALV